MSVGPEIFVVTTAVRYRRLARTLPQSSDCVLEVGCSFGKATQVLAKSAATVIGIDIDAAVIENTRARLAATPHVTLTACDARDIEAVRTLTAAPEGIFIDIGGDAPLGNIAAVVYLYLRSFLPRYMVIRNREMAAFLSLVSEVEVTPGSRIFAALAGKQPQGTFLRELMRSFSANDRYFAARKLAASASTETLALLERMKGDRTSKIRRIAHAVAKQRESSYTAPRK